MTTYEDLLRDRSGTMLEALSACAAQGTPIGFAQARDVMHGVNKGPGTYYSMVAWPSKRVMRVGLSTPEASATTSRYATVSWDSIFSLE